MKVIGLTGNYGESKEECTTYLMADSAILYTGRPFFIPDFAQRFEAAPSIVVRTGRLGKAIAPKFAHRYWDAFTAGFTVKACQESDERMAGLERAFDGAAMVGTWVPVAASDDALHTVVEFKVDGNVVSRCCLDDMLLPLHDALSSVSWRCSIKMGDLLFTGDAGDRFVLTPGMRLTATVAGKDVMDVKVRR